MKDLPPYERVKAIVARWLWNANMGYGSDPGDLQFALEQAGIDLAPEFEEIEEEGDRCTPTAVRGLNR